MFERRAASFDTHLSNRQGKNKIIDARKNTHTKKKKTKKIENKDYTFSFLGF